MMDLILAGGIVLDGTGNPGFPADVGVQGGKIASIGNLSGVAAGRKIDLQGLTLCPGFIDPHSHSDASLYFDNRLESSVQQGITTCVVGNCGESLAPVRSERMGELLKVLAIFAPPGADMKAFPWRSFAEYLHHLDTLGCAINTAHLVGFGTLRIAAGPGYEDRPPNEEETVAMQALVAEAMEAGAFGMSTGLVYSPQVYASTDEIISLARVIARYGGLYFSHIRGEGAGVTKAVEELIQIVEISGCAGGQIAHHKIAGKAYWGNSRQTLALIEQANDRGLSITCDQYPYERGMTSLMTLLPPWVHLGGCAKLVERLRDPDVRAKIRREVTAGIENWENWIRDAGFEHIFIAAVKTPAWQDIEGRSISQITRIKGKEDDWETLFDLLVDEQGEVTMVLEMMSEDDIRRIMKGRYTMFGTDSAGISPSGITAHGKPHPRHYGTYPRILGKYVREEGVLTLEDAVRRMTSFPAQRLGLLDRGLLRPGMWADLVAFDPSTVIDRATYEDPHRFPEGIHLVIVNGRIVLEGGMQNDCLPGKVLRSKAAAAHGLTRR